MILPLFEPGDDYGLVVFVAGVAAWARAVGDAQWRDLVEDLAALLEAIEDEPDGLRARRLFN
jgi:hypothetical protein